MTPAAGRIRLTAFLILLALDGAARDLSAQSRASAAVDVTIPLIARVDASADSGGAATTSGAAVAVLELTVRANAAWQLEVRGAAGVELTVVSAADGVTALPGASASDQVVRRVAAGRAGSVTLRLEARAAGGASLDALTFAVVGGE